jgi:hypothetical protein
MTKLEEYANNNHQPVNKNKTEFVIYHKSVQPPKIQIHYQGQRLQKQKSFKYLGFHLDSKLSFSMMLNAQFVKLRKSYTILKYIHRAFPTFYTLKMKFFQTYTWPYLYNLASIFCVFSITSQNHLNSFYRRCLRLIYCSFRASSNDLHGLLKLPTLKQKYQKCLLKRLKNVQTFENEILNCLLQYKNTILELQQHYNGKSHIKGLPIGRPNKRIVLLTKDTNSPTFLDKLFQFVWSE